MAYLVADKLGPETAKGIRNAAPFTINKFEDDVLVHYLDPVALRANPDGLGKIALEGHIISVNGKVLAGEFVKLKAYPALKQVPFAKLEEAALALNGDVYHQDFEATYVGDTIIDVEIFYLSKKPIRSYTLKSTLIPGLPGQDETANLILDHLAGDALTFRIRGLLQEPVSISRSAFKAFGTFVFEGIRHILEGLDHVLFVFCLALAARRFQSLLLPVTGFTIGHSITLSIGFFGYVPSGPWFAPLVETLIALSIIYAAIAAISKKPQNLSFLITSAIGLLHGLGFSFVLSDILKLDSANLWQNLLAFNVGVELGQIGIILLSWPLLWLGITKLPNAAHTIRLGLAIPCIAISSVWVGQRLLQVIANL